MSLQAGYGSNGELSKDTFNESKKITLGYFYLIFFIQFYFIFFNFFLFIIYLLFFIFIFGCVGSSFLCKGFLQLRRVGATLHRGARASHYRGLSLRSRDSRRSGSVVVAHGPSCSVACGIFPDQGSNPCPLHWQADSQPLHHQGSPHSILNYNLFQIFCKIFP